MADVFRIKSRPLDEDIYDAIVVFQQRAQDLLEEFMIEELKPHVDKRSMALAKTNLEQAIMWAVKAMTA